MSDKSNTSDTSADVSDDRATLASNGSTRPGYMLGGITGKGFMPGKSGHPSGRPKGRSIEEDLRRIMAEIPEGSRIDKQEGIVRIWLDEIICKRNTRAMIALLARLFPVPKSKANEAQGTSMKILFMSDPEGEEERDEGTKARRHEVAEKGSDEATHPKMSGAASGSGEPPGVHGSSQRPA